MLLDLFKIYFQLTFSSYSSYFKLLFNSFSSDFTDKSWVNGTDSG